MAHTIRLAAIVLGLAAHTAAQQHTQHLVPPGVHPIQPFSSLPAGRVFPHHRGAVRNGAAVLRLMVSRSPSADRSIRRYIGRRIALLGDMAHSGNADLVASGGIRLHVEIVPCRNVLPTAVSWSAGVLGTLVRVDRAHRTLTLRARPKDWHVGDTS